MKIELATGLYNVILKGNTVILDFMGDDHKHHRHYHRYKNREKAEYMWNLWGAGYNKIKIK